MSHLARLWSHLITQSAPVWSKRLSKNQAAGYEGSHGSIKSNPDELYWRITRHLKYRSGRRKWTYLTLLREVGSPLCCICHRHEKFSKRQPLGPWVYPVSEAEKGQHVRSGGASAPTWLIARPITASREKAGAILSTSGPGRRHLCSRGLFEVPYSSPHPKLERLPRSCSESASFTRTRHGVVYVNSAAKAGAFQSSS